MGNDTSQAEQKSSTDDIKTGELMDATAPKAKSAMVNKLTKEMQQLYKHKAKYKMNENGSITFYPTPKCQPSSKKLTSNKVSMDSFLADQNCKSALTYSDPDTPIIQQGGQTCSFLVASLLAWSEHYPFRFKPEHIWLLILQGVAVHVDQNSEKLRDKYVTHDGKMKLIIDISANPSREEWQSTIEAFATKIDENTVNDTCELFECDFTTSTLTEKIAAKVTIMDICKNYFDFRCRTCCGFPEITIDGTKDDWIKLKDKAQKLLKTKVDKKFGKQWGEALLPLLDRFIAAFNGEIDCVFWNSMIKRGSTSGSGAFRYYCGWLNILFPFLGPRQRWNNYCVPYAMDKGYVAQGFTLEGHGGWGVEAGADQEDFPTGLASAPVTWNNLGVEIKLRFLAGFVGFKQDEKTLEICPNIGWCIGECMSDKEIEEKKANRKKMYGW